MRGEKGYPFMKKRIESMCVEGGGGWSLMVAVAPEVV